MSKTKKIAILAIIAMVLTLMPTALFAATADSTRLEGAGRVETALDIASAGWTTAGTVVLAPADQANLVDALAAAPLAGQENAPILLTFKASLDAAVKAKIAALGATKVYVVGAVSDAVAAEVDAITNVTVEKLAGADRWATADAVNAKLTNPAGTFVVGYDAIADALSASSYAAKNKFAIVLAKADGTVDSAKLVGATKYIVGGTAKVAEISGVTRLSGADRYATNAEVASKLSYSYDRIYVANGVSLVDALAVAPLAAKYSAFVALASGSDVAAASVVNAKLNSSSKIIAVGGVNAVSETVKGKINTSNATVAITSVTAPDLGQIKVVYNKALSKTSSVDPLNYTLVAKNGGVANLTGATFTLSDDQTYVTIDLAVGTPLTNQKEYTLTVKDVYDAAGNKVAETSKDFSISDLTLPEVSKVEIVGTKTIKVTMSENVAAFAAQDRASFKLDNGALSAPSFAVGLTTAREFITLTLAAELSAGSHTLTVEAVKDLAGLYSTKVELPLNYAKDTTAPTVSIKEIKSDAKTVVLKFNKDIDPANLVGSTNINFSHTYKGSNQVNGTVVTQKTPSEYELVFGSPIPPGTTSIFIDYASGITDAQKVKDLFGNVFAGPVTLTATVSADFAAPTVTSISQKDADEIYVNFSEDVNAADAQIVGNFRLVNSKNESVNLTSATYVAADKRTTLKATANLEAGAYTLEVKNVHDKAVVPNKMTTVTLNIDLVDKVAPVVDAAAWTAASKKLTIKFSKDMVGSELTVLSNYALMVDGASKDWPSGTAIALKDSKTVEITLGSSVTGLDAAGDSVQLSGAFKSSSGVAIGGISVSKTIVVDTTIVPAYVADSAKVTKKDEVTFELNAELQAINAAKITFNGAAIADASYVNNGSKSVVTLKLAAPLANTAIGGWAGAGIQTTAAGGAYTAKFGGAEAGSVTLVAGANIKDKCAPYLPAGGVVTSDADKDGQIDTLTLTLSESVIGSTVAVADFSVSDSYSINSVTSVAGPVITLKLNESGLSDTAVKPSVAINGAMEDLANNGTSAGDAVVATDGAAPVVVAVKISTPGATAGFGNDLADALTLTFSEPVNTNFTAAAAPTIAELNAIFDSSDATTPFASAGAATFAATDLSVTASNTMVVTLGGATLTNVLVAGDTFYTDAAPTANDIEDVANITIAGGQVAIAATN